MRIGIVAVSSLSGAAVSDLINQVSVLNDHDQLNDYYIFLSGQHRFMENIMANRFHKIFVPFLPSNALLRSILAQFILPLYVCKHRLNVLYCLGGTAVLFMLFTSVRTVVLVQNANIFSRISNWSCYQKARNWILRYMALLSVKRANLVLYPSENSRRLFDEKFKLDHAKSAILPHAWYPRDVVALPGKTLDRNNIISVSSIMPYKNIEVLMIAYDKVVSNSDYKGKLLIIGDVSEQHYYQQLCDLKNMLHHGAKIEFLGKIKYEFILWFYTKADILVQSSIEETFGIPLVEAMGMRVPIIAADTELSASKKDYFNPVKEICDDAALYYDAFDAQALADAMLKLLKDRELCDKMKKSASIRIKNYDKNLLIKKLIQFFEVTAGRGLE